MSQKSNLYLLLKVVFILVFLPFVLIWGVWEKTDWSKRNKWLATAGIAVVFLFMIIPSGDKTDVNKQNTETTIPNSQTISSQEQIEEESRENIELTEANKIIDQEEAVVQENVEIQGEKLKVVSVTDGDTIKLENGKVVRYIGIDTPETVHPSKPVQCFGKEASDKNKELVNGKEVILVKDVSETDKYGRLLRYVYVGDIFVNDYLVKNGYAHSSSYPPDVKYQDQFRKSEEEARNNKIGLWADNACKVESAPVAPITPSVSPSQSNSGSGSYACNCSKTCPQMSSCAEAQYQLNVCGCSKRDADKDGIACDADCQ